MDIKIAVSLLVLLAMQISSIVGANTLYSGKSISENQTLTSANGIFKLGLVGHGMLDFNNEYSTLATLFSIWYNKLPKETEAWALKVRLYNPRDNDTWTIDTVRLQLTLSSHGNLTFYEYSTPEGTAIWSTNTSSDYNSTMLVLEDNGNLVVRSINNPHNVLWQSFDHPAEAWLPGAKIAFNKLSNIAQPYIAPYSTKLHFSFEMDQMNTRSIILKKNGAKYGSCRLIGISFTCSLDLGWYNGEVELLLHNNTSVSYVSNEVEAYFTYTVADSSIRTQFIIDNSGFFTQMIWSEDCQMWLHSGQSLANAYCDQYAVYNSKRKHDCSFSEHNYLQLLVSGCADESILQCHGAEKEGILLLHNAKIANDPYTSQIGSPKKCETACLQDCSCQAYYYDQDVCQMWNQTFFNIQYSLGYDFYYRLKTTKARKSFRFSWSIFCGCVGVVLIIALAVLIWTWRSFKARGVTELGSLVLFSYSALRRATKNFSAKLGEGGFGSVYKGKLSKLSQDIAVKHLKNLGQEDKSFRAEVRSLGEIYHVNLVRLLGFCVHRTERYLVYEYVRRGSLNSYISGNNSHVLDWKTRYHIVTGIAKGFAYLHGECRECIIHCDLKPENILLDDEFNPKVADFGLATLLNRDFSRVLTSMKGTYGYIAPEWFRYQAITSKADVYSYGMIIFEIISGQRIWKQRSGGNWFPLEMMQKLVSDGDVSSLVDSRLQGNANTDELTRACKVAGWCIQEDGGNRLSMAQVVRILEGVEEVANPPIPRFLKTYGDDSGNSSTVCPDALQSQSDIVSEELSYSN